MTSPSVLARLWFVRGDGSAENLGESQIPAGAVLPIGPDFYIDQSAGLVDIKFRAGSVDSELPDVPVGDLPLVVRTAEGGYELGSIRITPSWGFDHDGIDALWKGLLGIPPAARGKVRRTANWLAGAQHTHSADSFFLPALAELLSLTQHLFNSWPQLDTTTLGWRATGLPGGREEAMGTVRALARVPVGMNDERALPVKTLRRFGGSEPWRLRALYELAGMVASSLASAPTHGSDDRVHAAALLSRFGEVARPQSARRDVPRSSWPHSLRRWSDLAWLVFSQAEALSAGTDRAPLCNLYELYEAWTSCEVHQLLESKLGPPAIRMEVAPDRSGPGGPAWFSRWSEDDAVIEMWSQHSFGSRPERFLNDSWGPEVQSVTTELVPDVLLIAGDATGFTACAIDAKFTSKSSLPASVVSQTGSKYHWGLRTPEGRRAVGEVWIASNAVGTAMFSGQSAIEQTKLLPGSMSGSLESAVDQLIHTAWHTASRRSSPVG